LSKTARDVLEEFEAQTQIADDFGIHVLKVKVGENDDVEQQGNAQPVVKIEIDHEDKECLLHYEEGASAYVTVSDLKAEFISEVLEYEVCAAQEKILEGSHVRLDTPLVGFGENFELKYFFTVCVA
jgi:hypothetical protein